MQTCAEFGVVAAVRGGDGLRERKKAATREALGQAALRLALERGLDNVTADAIAEAANVSTRTFHNYFTGKEEAILAAFREILRGLMEQIRSRPAQEPIWDTLQYVVLLLIIGTDGGPRETVAMTRMIENPGFLTHHLDLFDEVERMSAEVIAERTGTNVETDLYPHLITGAASVAMKSALKLWEGGKVTTALPDLVNDAFAQLRAGLPQPPT